MSTVQRRTELQQQLREEIGEDRRRELEVQLYRVKEKIQESKQEQEYWQKEVEWREEQFQKTSREQEEGMEVLAGGHDQLSHGPTAYGPNYHNIHRY